MCFGGSPPQCCPLQIFDDQAQRDQRGSLHPCLYSKTRQTMINHAQASLAVNVAGLGLSALSCLPAPDCMIQFRLRLLNISAAWPRLHKKMKPVLQALRAWGRLYEKCWSGHVSLCFGFESVILLLNSSWVGGSACLATRMPLTRFALDGLNELLSTIAPGYTIPP